jgi:hypothetical protein
MTIRSAAAAVGAVLYSLIGVSPVFGQVTPAAGYVPPDDTPSIRVGATIFADYTITQEPKATDADQNQITPNSFNIGRSYINVTGQISHLVAFRVTPDIARETLPGSALNGSYTFRLKYVYAQFNLDDWMGRGTWVRLGMQPTPYVNYIEDIYRYRFQGGIQSDRDAFLSSSDVGATFHYNFPANYGDVHGGIYNGETYSRFEANDQKAFQVRASLRPMRTHPVLRGLRLAGFVDADAYVQNAERRRLGAAITFEHAWVNAGGEYLDATDQLRAASPELGSRAFSLWATPKMPKGFGWEGLLRFDHLIQEQATSVDGERDRTIAGVAYWFPRQGSVSAAVLFDYEHVNNRNYVEPTRRNERRWAVHTLINF